MNEQRSIATLLTDLDTRIGELRRQVALHKQQEEHHREQGASSARELAELETRLAEFRNVADALLAVAPPPSPRGAAPVPFEAEDWGTQARPKIGKMVEWVIAERQDEEPFNASEVSRLVNQRFRDRMKRATDARQISVTLRRLAAAGTLTLSRKGKAYEEALYVRG